LGWIIAKLNATIGQDYYYGRIPARGRVPAACFMTGAKYVLIQVLLCPSMMMGVIDYHDVIVTLLLEFWDFKFETVGP
jgi:hypothetical protein